MTIDTRIITIDGVIARTLCERRDSRDLSPLRNMLALRVGRITLLCSENRVDWDAKTPGSIIVESKQPSRTADGDQRPRYCSRNRRDFANAVCASDDSGKIPWNTCGMPS
jgi:hypothetical protein